MHVGAKEYIRQAIFRNFFVNHKLGWRERGHRWSYVEDDSLLGTRLRVLRCVRWGSSSEPLFHPCCEIEFDKRDDSAYTTHRLSFCRLEQRTRARRGLQKWRIIARLLPAETLQQQNLITVPEEKQTKEENEIKNAHTATCSFKISPGAEILSRPSCCGCCNSSVRDILSSASPNQRHASCKQNTNGRLVCQNSICKPIVYTLSSHCLVYNTWDTVHTAMANTSPVLPVSPQPQANAPQQNKPSEMTIVLF